MRLLIDFYYNNQDSFIFYSLAPEIICSTVNNQPSEKVYQQKSKKKVELGKSGKISLIKIRFGNTGFPLLLLSL